MLTAEQLTGLDQAHLSQIQTPYQTLLTHHSARSDLLALIQAAEQAGFCLEIASGFRDFFRQQTIWNNKFNGVKPILDEQGQILDPDTLSDKERIFAILRWSALPGASRHHWGTDFDIYAKNLLPSDQTLKLEPWEYLQGHQYDFHQWLLTSAAQFGFHFPYQKDLGGVAAEPWHISYFPVSTPCLNALTLPLLQKQLEKHPLAGHPVILKNLEIIYNRFILNICPE